MVFLNGSSPGWLGHEVELAIVRLGRAKGDRTDRWRWSRGRDGAALAGGGARDDRGRAASSRGSGCRVPGPAYLVSVGYMDPGNWATDLEGGARFGYALIWVLLMSNLMAVLLQTLSARLGVVTGHDLAQACRAEYSRRVNAVLWLLAEVAIAACDLAYAIRQLNTNWLLRLERRQGWRLNLVPGLDLRRAEGRKEQQEAEECDREMAQGQNSRSFHCGVAAPPPLRMATENGVLIRAHCGSAPLLAARLLADCVWMTPTVRLISAKIWLETRRISALVTAFTRSRCLKSMRQSP